jgi:dTDP-glucose pyrophosphorylase
MKILKNSNIRQAIKILNKSGARTLTVVDNNDRLIGTLTDGDIRKSIIKGFNLKNLINKVYNKNPIFVYENKIDLKKIKEIFLKKKIYSIPVVNKMKKIIKILLLEDMIDLNNNNYDVKKYSKKFGVVIMAGGKGVRMRPYTKIFPKPLLPVGDDTVIDLIISKFLIYRINNFYITTNYKYEAINSHFKKYKKKINYKLIKEKKNLGTSGSLYYLKNLKEDFLFVSNCDTVVSENYNDILNFHVNKKNDITIVVSKKTIQLPYGVCLINNKKKFNGFKEKPSYDFLLNTGLYLINRNQLKILKKNQKIDMNDFILKLKKKKKKIGLYQIDYNKWKDLGNWVSYNKFIKNDPIIN